MERVFAASSASEIVDRLAADPWSTNGLVRAVDAGCNVKVTIGRE